MKQALFLLLFLPNFILAQVNLNQGLVAYYPFNGNANDQSGNNNNPIFNNATLTADRFGNANGAYYFDGMNNYMRIPTSPSLVPQEMSLCAIVKPMGFYMGNCYNTCIIDKGSPDYLVGNYSLRYTASAYLGYVCNTTDTFHQNFEGRAYINPISPLYTPYVTSDTWYCLVYTVSADSLKLYVNGILKWAEKKQYPIGVNSMDLMFGRKDDGTFPYWYKGVIDEIRIYNRAINIDEVRALGCANVSCNTQHDFSIVQNACAPSAVSFSASTTTYNSIEWDFGDGNTMTSSLNPSHLYNSYGNYPVRMILNYGNNCSDTILKTISIDVQIDNQLLLTEDTTICFGSTKQLRTNPSLSFCWDPTTYLDNPNSPNPTTSTPRNITYYFTTQVTGPNLITNGDFSGGNSGFTSEYNYATPNITEGEYFVGTNPTAWNPQLSSCKDHTSAGGNMMLVNGSPVANVNVWKQTVTVTPNTNYAFSTWIQALWPPNPAQLQFSINGNDVGTPITASLPTCTLTQFYTTWNSGNSTTATISIVNKNIEIQGNDFALDDISFAPVHIKRDSVVIVVEKPTVKASNDTSTCTGTQIPLNATGAVTYSWSPSAGLSNSNIANPIASLFTTTQYIVSGTTANGCDSKDTVNITVYPKPIVTTSNDTAICNNSSAQLFATGGVTYNWSPSATLSNSSVSNPVASPLTNTIYYVTVTDSRTCKNKDSVRVDIRPDPIFTINNPKNICTNNSAQLVAGGGNLYSWQPTSSLSNPAISNPTASPQGTTNYSVQITDTVCNNTSTLSTLVTVLPSPIVTATKSNDLDCSNGSSQLNATGAAKYSWSPSNTLNNPGIANPTAQPSTQTTYTVVGTDANGCVNSDSVTVNITGLNKGGYWMPSAFTPNNDGLNDCYGIKFWGIIEELDFGIYNRWGERIFHTSNPSGCWDGTYKGVKQNPDVFVYLITAKTSCGKVFRKGTFALIR